MSQQIIDIGAEANDGTGDPLRSAFSAVNENFSEVYAAGPVGSNVTIAGNTITVSGINNNLVLAANGIGNIQANSTIMPSIDAVYDLGSADNQFNTAYAAYFVGNGSGLTGVSVDAGNVILNGTSNVRIGAANANVTVTVNAVPNVAVFTTAGLQVPGNVTVGNVIANTLSLSGLVTSTLNSQSNITTTANISAAFVLGNGSQLTGMYSNTNVQNFLPTYTGSLDSLAGNVTTTANINGGNIRTTGLLNATGTITGGNVTSLGRVTAIGNVVSNGFFIGDGSLLTGVISAPANLFNTVNANGTSLIADSTAAVLTLTPGNNIVITGNDLTLAASIGVSQDPVFGGNISAAGNIVSSANISTTANVNGGNVNASGLITGGNISTAGNVSAGNITATSNVSAGNIVAAGNVSGAAFFGNGIFRANGSVEIDSGGNVVVSPAGAAPNTNWTFIESGNIVLGQGYGKVINNGSFGVSLWATDFADASIEWSDNGTNQTSNVVVDANITLSTNAGASTWRFDSTGNLILPNAMKVASLTGDVDTDSAIVIGGNNTKINIEQNNEIDITSSDGTGNSFTWTFGNAGNLSFPGGATIADGVFDAGSPSATVSLSAASPDGNTVSVRAQGNTSSAVIQTYANATATTNTWTFGVDGVLSTLGNISAGYFIGNGSQLTGLPASYSNANVSTYLASGTNSANIITTGNVSGSFLLGNGASITNVNAVTLLGNVPAVAANASSLVQRDANGNITGNFYLGNASQMSGLPAAYSNAAVAEFLPTYTGSLDSLLGNVVTTGNIRGGNISSPGAISAVGNITGDYLFGNGSLLTGVVSSYTNADVAAFLPTYTGNLVALTGNVTTTANVNGGNIVTTGIVQSGTVSATGTAVVGNLTTAGAVSAATVTTSGNAVIGGDLIVNGNVTYINVTDLNVEDPVIGLGRGANNTPLTTNDGKDRGEQLWYYTDAERSAFVGYDNSEGKMIVAANVTISDEIVTVNNYGTAVVGNLESANVTATGNIVGGNINTAGLVSATGSVIGGNISTAGTITSTGNIVGGNINTAGLVSATGSVIGGNISTAGTITATGNIVGANVNTTNLSLTGNVVSALNVTGNVTGGNLRSIGSVTAAFISSSGNIVTGSGTGGNITGANVISGTTLSVSGNVAGANVNAGFISATGNVDSLTVNTDNIFADVVSVVGNVVGGNIVTSGQVNATANITGGNIAAAALISAATATVTGTITGGNLATGGTVSATGDIAGGNLSTSGTVSAGGTVTGGNLATGGNISAVGNVTGGNIVTSNSVSALDIFASGNVSAVGNVRSGNIISQGLATITGTVTGGNLVTGGNITASGTITSTGTITGGNLVSTAQISSAGNITAVGNVIADTFIGNLLGNITAPGANTQIIFNQAGVLGGTTGLRFDYVGNALTVGGDINTQNGGNVSVAGALSVTGNISMGIGNINGSNIRGTVISASGNVLGGNIVTSGAVTATGNVSGSNISTAGLITATGNITSTANVNGGNISTAGLITATGTITGGNLVTSGTVSASGTVTSGNLSTSGTVSAGGTVTGGNISTAGLITATGSINSSANIAAVGNVTGGNVIASNLTATRIVVAGASGVLTDVSGFEYTTANSTLTVANIAAAVISVTGNVTGGNILTGGFVSATGNVTGGNLLAATLSLSGNVLSALNMETNITTTGDISANNITATTSINIAGNPVATVDDATALAIALG
jgi:fibronectin-binding autotransporter adhesin